MGSPILDRDGRFLGVFFRSQMPRSHANYHRPAGLPEARPGRLARGRMQVGGALVALACAIAATLPTAAVAATSTLVIEGAGEGHGVGLSQDGALGYARHGASYQQILGHYYTGTTIGKAAGGTVVKVLVGSKVKRVPLERYVRGVIGAEMSPSWPAAALEAQAVASRTYALTAHAGGSRFDVYADTRSQVYNGGAAESAATNAAVSATAGQILMYGGKAAITYFFASSGGMTESVQDGFPGSEAKPWLVGVIDPFEGTASRWQLELPFATAARRLRGLFKGTFHGIEVRRRGTSPRILSARVLGTTAATVLSGPALAGRLGLTSTWAYFDVRTGSSLKQEPDHSGQARTWKPVAPAPATVLAQAPSRAGGIEPSPASAAHAPTAGASGGVEAP
ncbi:MAG: SpoIID/LytB domain protein [Solirubrobacterales bacterium]|nr:SpoIID/LytB domain protein [Solirubrobacterales bacterium]